MEGIRRLSRSEHNGPVLGYVDFGERTVDDYIAHDLGLAGFIINAYGGQPLLSDEQEISATTRDGRYRLQVRHIGAAEDSYVVGETSVGSLDFLVESLRRSGIRIEERCLAGVNQ